LEIRFLYNQLKNPKFGQITQLQVINIDGYGALGVAIFENLLLKQLKCILPKNS